MREPMSNERGLTLIEVLIVVLLIGLLTGVAIIGSGFFNSARLRASAGLTIQAVRRSLARANATGYPVRLVFDLQQNRLILEESSSRRMLRDRGEDAGTSAGAEAATVVELEAQADAERILGGPRGPRPRFSPVKNGPLGGTGAEIGRALDDGIRFVGVQTEHDEEFRSEGRAYLYFWPGGSTERAVIQLAPKGEDAAGLTVHVSSLTGRARIERELNPLPEQRSDEGYSERDE